MTRLIVLTILLALTGLTPAAAQSPGPLRIEITEGVIEPLPFAAPQFVAETPGAQAIALPRQGGLQLEELPLPALAAPRRRQRV